VTKVLTSSANDDDRLGRAKVIGVVLCVLHVLVSWTIILKVTFAPSLDAQWELMWVPLFVMDFPVSLVFLAVTLVFPGTHIPGLPYPFSEVRAYAAPAVCHGVLGPIWYFFLPQIWVRSRRILSGSRSTGSGGH
jgi:hypothetical protein